MNSYLAYVNGLGGGSEVQEWVTSTLAKRAARTPLEQTEAEHVLDYLMSPVAPKRLRRMSYDQAKAAAEKWSKANQKKGRDIAEGTSDVEVIHDFMNGTRIVRLLTKAAFQREGFLMSHCVGGYNPDSQDVHIYSYRDAKNMPHATFEVRRQQKEITQIKGKGNGAIHPRYINPILTFLQTIGIKVRPHDMKNLGYLHVPQPMLELVLMVENAEKEIQTILGERYVYWSEAVSA
jgi:hypothetical protein